MCAIGIFCAGTPATRGTLDLLKKFEIDPAMVRELCYRGRGWPGDFAVRREGEKDLISYASYADSWDFAQRYRPLRCYLCPDGTAETADISCGDPWYRDPKTASSGHSLVLVRTEKGRRILRGAIEQGYVTLKSAAPKLLGLSQKNLQAKRSEIAGRLTVMRLAGIPVPRFHGWPLARNWWGIGLKEKARSVYSTIKRVVTRGLYRPDTPAS